MSRLAAVQTAVVLALGGGPTPVGPHPGERVGWVVVWGWVILGLIAIVFVAIIGIGLDAYRRNRRSGPNARPPRPA